MNQNDPPFYSLDETTIELLTEVLGYAGRAADAQVDRTLRQRIFDKIAQVHMRFNLPEASALGEQKKPNPTKENSNPVVTGRIIPLKRKPSLSIISGGKDDEPVH